MLADGLVTVNDQKQANFEATLFQYLWVFSISTIVIGSLIHFYLTKKLMRPLRDLIESTKRMKEGHYPTPITMNSKDEIGELTNHFNELVQQLKDNEQHRQKLVSDLSHEFRTPLSNVNGYLLALKNGVVVADTDLYQSLYEESKRLIQLVEQMEQLKEWDYVSKQTFSEKKPVDIKDLINQSVDMFRWTIKKNGIEVQVEVESSMLKVDHGAISQVLNNLIDNAIQYYEGTDPITIKGEKRLSEYCIFIKGPGRPIPYGEQKRIFERFYRVDQSRSRELGGSGLGLAISKEIIEHHKGKIGVESEEDIHVFWFTLPVNN